MSEPFLGEIRICGFNFAPQGWAFCNGQALSIAQNDALFGLIGTTYGGDGTLTFALPDLRGRVPVHQGEISTTDTPYSLGQSGGVETAPVSLQQLPSHAHPVQAHSSPGDQTSPQDAVWASSSVSLYAPGDADVSMNENIVTPAGGGQSHENVMPFLAVSFVIALVGIYPSRA